MALPCQKIANIYKFIYSDFEKVDVTLDKGQIHWNCVYSLWFFDVVQVQYSRWLYIAKKCKWLSTYPTYLLSISRYSKIYMDLKYHSLCVKNVSTFKSLFVKTVFMPCNTIGTQDLSRQSWYIKHNSPKKCPYMMYCL